MKMFVKQQIRETQQTFEPKEENKRSSSSSSSSSGSSFPLH